MSIVCACASHVEAAPKVETTNNDTSATEVVAPKIAFVNLQQIVTLDPAFVAQCADEWQELYARIQKKIEPLDKALAALEERYLKGKTEFETLSKGGLAKQEALETKYREVLHIENELRSKGQEHQALAQEEVAKAQAAIGPKIDKAINDIRVRKGYDMILRRDAVLASDAKFDVTREVRFELNKRFVEDQKHAAKAETPKQSAQSAKTASATT